MRKQIITLLFLLASTTAIAGSISMQSGDSIEINPGQTMTITCEGSGGSNGSVCVLKRENGWYNIYVNGSFYTNHAYESNAFEKLKALKDAGVCD
jgi:uncharacterized protein YjlB